jgi:hypothetical protein
MTPDLKVSCGIAVLRHDAKSGQINVLGEDLAIWVKNRTMIPARAANL